MIGKNVEIMKKWVRYGIVSFSFCCLFLFFAGSIETFAAVTEGKPGQIISGEYAVIVNTSTGSDESTGTLVFDDSGNGTTTVCSAASKDETWQNTKSEQRNTSVRDVTSFYTIGEQKTISSGSVSQTYICIGEGEHCYIWMSTALKESYDAAGKTELIAKDMARTYDGVPYRMLSTLAGGEIPYQDNTGKLSILLETLSGASGIYRGDYGITAIHINAPDAASYQLGNMESRNGLLVHEGQHALFHLKTEYDFSESYLWLNEGLAVAAMDYIWGGTDNSGWLDGIAGNTDIRNGSSLLYKSYRDSSARDYGMPYLFIRYLIARKTGGYNPMGLLPAFYQQSANCDAATYLTNVLGDGTTFTELLTDFYTAIIAQETNGKYGFAGDAIIYEKVKDYPFYMGSSGEAHILPPTGAIAIRLKNGSFTVPQDGDSSIRYMIVSEGRQISTPSEGDGSSGNPYRITTFRDLNLIGNQPDAYYQLESDITVNDQINLTVTNFRGVLEGNGHVIRGLKQPLTGRNSGTIRNLTIEADFDGEYAGVQGVFAQINEGLIADCVVGGSVKLRMLRSQSNYAETTFGGIAGLNNVAGTIRGCGFTSAVSVQVPAIRSWVGGIAGIQMGMIEKCYGRGLINVTQPDGAAHTSFEIDSSDSYDVYVGGIAGEIRKQGAFGGSMSYCVYSGSIQVYGGNQAVGQLCGLVNNNVVNSTLGLSGHLTGCYAKKDNGHVLGYSTGQIEEDKMLLSDEEAKNPASYQGWNFDGDWKIDEKGPVRLGAADIQSLTVIGAPTDCYVGEKLFGWGKLQVNGGSGYIPVTEDMVSGFDSRKSGAVTVTVSYLGRMTSFPVNVKEPQSVSEMKVVSGKERIYNEGESFDPGTVYLLATIDGRSNRLIYSGFDYSPKRPLTAADTIVTVSYYDGSAQYPITVKRKAVTSITVTNKIETVRYQEGQKLNLSAVRVQLTYNNGEKTAVLTPDQFEDYGIHVAKASNDNVTAINKDAVLLAGDDGAAIYLYAGDTLPGTYGTVAACVGTVNVWEILRIQKKALHMVSGREGWLSSEAVTGGSGSYTTTVVSENLPSGVSRVRMPGNGYQDFGYRGTAVAPVGSVYRSMYRVTDTMTDVSILVEIEIEIHGSNEAAFYQFDLLKSFNQGLSEDVVGIIKENTILLKVPEGTNVSNLRPTIEFGYNMGVELPAQFWNGTFHDFTKPVVYTLTAPDGVTKKRYVVSVEFTLTSGDDKPDEGGTVGGDKPNGGETSDNSALPSLVPEVAYPSVGKVIRFRGAYYQITASTASLKTVELKGLVKKKTSSLRMPETIKISGYKYKVTGIGKQAFQNNNYLKRITLSKYVTVIETNAFKGCKKLRTLTLKGTGLQSVGKNAVRGIYNKAVIRVPKKSVKTYKKLFSKKTGYVKSMKIHK